jgi:hypothetical protein
MKTTSTKRIVSGVQITFETYLYLLARLAREESSTYMCEVGTIVLHMGPNIMRNDGYFFIDEDKCGSVSCSYAEYIVYWIS